ncbi:MAG: PAS domain S-box protein [Desulfobacteraceae bacterium]|nr:PAS domain S-box protein [Desulfobacteraceae bacterium]
MIRPFWIRSNTAKPLSIGQPTSDCTHRSDCGWSLIAGGLALLLFGSLSELLVHYIMKFNIAVYDSAAYFIFIKYGLMHWIGTGVIILGMRKWIMTGDNGPRPQQSLPAPRTIVEKYDNYRDMLDNISDPIFLYDKATKFFVKCNKAAVDRYGYSSAEIKQMRPWDLHPEEEKALVQKNAASDIRHNPYYYTHLTKTGVRIPVEVYTNSIQLDGRHLWLSITHDQTRFRDIENSLVRSEERLRLTLEAVNDALWDYNMRTGEVYFSPNYYTMLGYEPYELPPSDETFKRLLHPDDVKKIVSPNNRTGEKLGKWESEFRMKSKSGEWLWILSRGNIIEIDTDGRPLRQVGTHTDITERKKQEKERLRLKNQLEQACKLESVATLAGGIAHQYNNVLSGISGHLELMKMKSSENENLCKHIRQIDELSQRMAQLTRQLMSYAKGGKHTVKSISVFEFVSAITPSVKKQMKPGMDLINRIEKDGLMIKGDPVQIESVLTAIITNACESIQANGRIVVRAEKYDAPEVVVGELDAAASGPYAKISVEDNGCGMEGDIQQRVMEPFFTTKFQGRGMGMAAAHSIVKDHNGWIDISSEIGQGTIVNVYMPLENRTMNESVADPDTALARKGTVLLIEDDLVVMDVSKTLLEALGFNVLPAPTGSEASTIAQSHQGDIDLAILDVVLPDMEALDVYPTIKKARPSLKVLVCSGYSSEGPVQDILDAGAEDFIQKPFTMTALSSKIDQVLLRGAG